MSLLEIFSIVLLISITKVGDVEGLQWCWDGGNLKEYGPDKICCRKILFNKVDNNNRERGCCLNNIYYTQTHDCIDGKLESFAPLEAIPTALSQPMGERTTDRKMTDMTSGICEKNFVYRLRNPKTTNKTDQYIRTTVHILNLIRLKKTGKAKWRTFKQIRINMDESLNRKYIGKTVFVFSDKNLLMGKSFNLSLGNIIKKDKFRMKHIKRCSTT